MQSSGCWEVWGDESELPDAIGEPTGGRLQGVPRDLIHTLATTHKNMLMTSGGATTEDV